MCVLQWISCPLLSSTDKPEVYRHAQVMEASVDTSTPPPSRPPPPPPSPLPSPLPPSLSLPLFVNLESHLVFALFSCHNKLGHIKYLFYVRAASLSSYILEKRLRQDQRRSINSPSESPSPVQRVGPRETYICVLQWISCPLLSSTDEPEVYRHAQVMEASVDTSTPCLPPSPLSPSPLPPSPLPLPPPSLPPSLSLSLSQPGISPSFCFVFMP